MQCVTRVTGSYAYLLGPKCDSFICVCVCVCVLVTQLCPTLCDPWTVAHQAPLSMGFPRQEYWSGLPFPFLRIFPTQGWNLGLPHCRQILYWWSHQESPGDSRVKACVVTITLVLPLDTSSFQMFKILTPSV